MIFSSNIKQVIENMNTVNVFYDKFDTFFYTNFKFTPRDCEPTMLVASSNSHFISTAKGNIDKIKRLKQEVKLGIYNTLNALEKNRNWFATEEEKVTIRMIKQRITQITSKYDYIVSLLETFEIVEK